MKDSERETAVAQIEALESPRFRLTSWELDFLSSVSDQLTRTGELSERQLTVLDKIHKEKA
jgi:hypothetical protein